MVRFIIGIFIFVVSLSATDDFFTIKQDDAFHILSYHTKYLKDNNYTIDEVRKMEFIRYNSDIINFGFLSPPYWFKLQIQYDKSMRDREWMFSIDNPLIDYIDFYIYDENQKLVMYRKSGDLNYDIKQDIHQNSFIFMLPHDYTKKYTIYMRVETSGAMFIPMRIISAKKLLEKTHMLQTFSGVYYGVLFMLILYNFIIFLYTKEKVYGQYVIFVVSYAFWQLSFDGMGVLYLWQDVHWLREKGTSFFIFTSILSILLFSKTLLKAKENIPKVNKYLINPFIVILSLSALLSIVFPYKYTIVVGAVLSILVPSILFGGSLIVLRKNYYSIRLFVLGWGTFLLSTILFSLSKFNIVPGYIIMKYGQQIGSAIDMILLSGALAERFKRLEDEYTYKLKNHNIDLKLKVKEALKKERENEKILLEQSRLAQMGEMIEQIAHQWRQPLNNIGLLNQDMYFKKKLNTLSEDEFEKIHEQIDTNLQFMSNTIDDFRTYYKSEKDAKTYLLRDALETILHIVEATLKHSNIAIVIHGDESIMVRNIRNELFQVLLNIINNAKDALILNDVENKKIEIRFRSSDKYAYIDIYDNAGGVPDDIIDKIFDPYFSTKFSNQGTGIGLYMSKIIIEKNMSGRLSVKNTDEGACFTIRLPLAENMGDNDG